MATSVRVTIRWSPVKPIEQVAKIATLCRRLPCLMGHHHTKIEMRDRNIALRCDNCGWKSPGWKVGARGDTDESSDSQFSRAAEILMQKPRKHA